MVRPARTNSVAVALSVFGGILVALWLIPLTPISGWLSGLHWIDASHALFILAPLVVMAVLGRAPEEYGLRPTRLRNEIAVGGCIALAVILAPLLAESIFGRIQLRRDDLGFIASVIVYKFFFVGFGEELLFRGLIEVELNRSFEKRFRFGSLRFGWGLMLTAALFGFAHVLNPFNPAIGSFALDFGDLLPTAVIGLMLGFFREYYGSILAASLNSRRLGSRDSAV